MLSRRKDSADISDEVPTFHVRYIGATETYVPNGKGCTKQPLQKLWDNAPTERHLRRVAIQFSLSGVYMRDMESKKVNDNSVTWFNMEDISYCAADTEINDRLFCWICKHPESRKMEAHAVLCSTREKAQTMAAVLSRAFQLAYRDWKAERQKQERRKVSTSLTFPEPEMEDTNMNSCYAVSDIGNRRMSEDNNNVRKSRAMETDKPPD